MEVIMRKHIKNNVSWVGKIDWELNEFHGSDYSINNGSSQNAYLIEEEKTVLIDTVWKPHSSEFIDNLEAEIDLNKYNDLVVEEVGGGGERDGGAGVARSGLLDGVGGEELSGLDRFVIDVIPV